MRKFNSGQGYVITCYLPKPRVMEAVVETLTATPSVEGHAAMQMPSCKEKRCDDGVFDPAGLLFPTGVHMPLLVFLGDRSRRSEGALVRREEKAAARKKGSGKDRAPDSAQPKTSEASSSASPAVAAQVEIFTKPPFVSDAVAASRGRAATAPRRVPPPPPLEEAD